MSISTIKGMYGFLIDNTGFSGRTVHSIILALGYRLYGSDADFKELSGILKDCSNYGADSGFCGFTYYDDTIYFFRKHRHDIVSHLEQTAADLGTDIISMVQNFGVFRSHSQKPTASEIGRALWDSGKCRSELTELYNVFSWYTLEEVAHAWNRYLEDNPALAQELSA